MGLGLRYSWLPRLSAAMQDFYLDGCPVKVSDVWFRSHMMTSSNGSIFGVTGPFCGEFTGDRWIPRTKASDAELWCFFHLCLNKRLSKKSRGWWFETPSCPLWRHCNDFCQDEQFGQLIFSRLYIVGTIRNTVIGFNGHRIEFWVETAKASHYSNITCAPSITGLQGHEITIVHVHYWMPLINKPPKKQLLIVLLGWIDGNISNHQFWPVIF